MQFDLSHQILDDKGEPAKDELGKAADLKTVLSRALLTDTADNAKSKLERFELYMKLRASELKADLTTEEAKLIKDASSVYPTIVYGQLVRWIEGKV